MDYYLLRHHPPFGHPLQRRGLDEIDAAANHVLITDP